MQSGFPVPAAWLAGLVLAAAASLSPVESGRTQTAHSERPVVAAASSLRFALPELVEAFTQKTGRRIRVSFGSSGNLTRQIAQGAPFALFLSADESYVRRLVESGHTRGEGAVYGRGRLVLMVPGGSPLEADAGLDGLAEALETGQLKRFAIANPAHAPYGMRAREALQSAGLWQAIQPHLLLGENVGQAAQFAASAEAQGGLVALSLAKSPRLAAKTESAPVPAELHSPLSQRMVLLRGAGKLAEDFYSFLQSPRARRIFARYGFRLPDGAS